METEFTSGSLVGPRREAILEGAGAYFDAAWPQRGTVESRVTRDPTSGCSGCALGHVHGSTECCGSGGEVRLCFRSSTAGDGTRFEAGGSRGGDTWNVTGAVGSFSVW